ncbi:MAG: IS3 family transposase [Clostridiales bacterium]|jgi:transposase InsO family protein|nr:IS3 family transposase [Clostridiales bacterium]
MREEGESLKASYETLDTSRNGHYRQTGSGIRRSSLNETLVEKIKELRLAHPFWGYRRMTAWLRSREGYGVNRKRIQKLMRENGLTVEHKRHKALRITRRAKPRATRPNHSTGALI